MTNVANLGSEDRELVFWAVAWLGAHLPASWTVKLTNSGEQSTGDAGGDTAIEIRGPQSFSRIAIEARRSMGPRDVDRLLGSVGRKLRAMAAHIPILVVAPWLSARTRGLLTAEGVNYIDLTGNALVRLDYPALYIETAGAARNPTPAPRGKARVRGPKASRLIRTLIDVSPPYGVGELAAATGLAPGYVSRLLDALDDDALIDRSKRGRVETVEIAALLRRWSEDYDLLATNQPETFLAPRGARHALETLGGLPDGAEVVVTGSFAAVRIAPVAAPALLAAYSNDPAALAQALDLIPADQGSNVVLLRPFDEVVWARTEIRDGIRYAAPSQAAVDCLTGNGRMPAEGEAILQWMLANETRWRRGSLRSTPT